MKLLELFEEAKTDLKYPYPDKERIYGVIPDIKYIPTEFLTPYEDLKSQWRTIREVMATDGKTEEQWATWWLQGNKHPAKVYFSRDGLIIHDGHHRFIAAKILKIPLRVNVEVFYVDGWEINDFIENNNLELKKYGRKYLK